MKSLLLEKPTHLPTVYLLIQCLLFNRGAVFQPRLLFKLAANQSSCRLNTSVAKVKLIMNAFWYIKSHKYHI